MENFTPVSGFVGGLLTGLAVGGGLDGRLISGLALFGVGWGMVGFCPGPAFAALATGLTPGLAFVAAMIAGMAFHGLIVEDRTRGVPPAPERPAGSLSATRRSSGAGRRKRSSSGRRQCLPESVASSPSPRTSC